MKLISAVVLVRFADDQFAFTSSSNDDPNDYQPFFGDPETDLFFPTETAARSYLTDPDSPSWGPAGELDTDQYMNRHFSIIGVYTAD